LVSTWFDPFVYLYEEVEDEFSFVKAIDLQIDRIIDYKSVSMEQSDQFFEVKGTL
jgi:hypothetical protein